MATPRQNPSIHVTWLAKTMAGDSGCQWQYWFQTHNSLNRQAPNNPAFTMWQIDHTRALTELGQELRAKMLHPQLERRVNFREPRSRVPVYGSADCVVENDGEVTVYDCKTRDPKSFHQIQVMIYMYGLSREPQYETKKMRGVVIYPFHREEIPLLEERFDTQLGFFVELLAGDREPLKAPGDTCRFCKLAEADCPDRVLSPKGAEEFDF